MTESVRPIELGHNLKGHVQIDLHNHKTGFTERIEKDNLITDGVERALAFASLTHIPYDLFPMYERLMGGMVLFENPLTESKTNVYFPGAENKIVGWSNQISGNTDQYKGIINTIESGPVQGGYKTVWDFSTSQANGTINAVSRINNTTPFTPFFANFISGSSPTIVGRQIKPSTTYPPVYTLGIHEGYIYTVCSESYKVVRTKVPTNIMLTSQWRNNYGEVVEVGDQSVVSSLFKNWNQADGGAPRCVNRIKSRTNTTFTVEWRELDFSDFSVTTNSTTFNYENTNVEVSSSTSRCIIGDYIFIFVTANRITKLMRFNISDTTDVVEYCDRSIMSGSGNDFFIDDTLTARFITSDSKHSTIYSDGTSLISERPFDPSFGYYSYQYPLSTFKEGNHKFFGFTYDNNLCLFCPNMLMSICNLDSPIVKTSDHSMKVTYTLLEAD